MTDQLASLFDENQPNPKAMAIPPLTERTVRPGAVSGATSGAPSYGKGRKVDIGRAVKTTSFQEVKGAKK